MSSRPKLQILLSALNQTLKTTRRTATRSHKEANAIAAAASPSMSGEVFHSRQQALLNAQNLKSLQLLTHQVKSALLDPPPSTIRPPCFITIKSPAPLNQFYFVSQPVHLAGFNFVTPQSPLGQALAGKKPGAKFRSPSLSGQILKIE